MQRQSLGSPVTKLHSHGEAKTETLSNEDLKRKDLPSPLVLTNNHIDEEHKTAKPRRFSTSPQSPPPKPDKLIHLIPALTLFCFLVLYLFSHTPSPSDLAQFNGFHRSAKLIDSTVISNIDRLSELRRSNVLAIRSLRNLQDVNKPAPRYRSHRKIADF
ncbi:hypothetical protein HS088_TW20G00086 [Tripterygium wilfordii]|uniref:Uncharacterized protein n=1 Tax=Tripterygium wilfordii TaxID=458696 RepID=A0A7J7C6I8_TRIWF|nr:uncharacterized protein LOC119986576 [Tripterygium wilfordii]KAF5729722.1 hypothetical protein HS088_TW20G00086 [Tripterygium wilfordii]